MQRLFIPALDFKLVAIPKNQRTKAVPFRFKDPLTLGRQFIDSFCQHREHRRVHRKVHFLIL